MQQKVPAQRKPPKNWQQIPVGRVNGLALFDMTAKIVAIRPDLNSTPGNGMFSCGGASLVRIRQESDLHREAIAAANHDFALPRHQWASQYFLRS